MSNAVQIFNSDQFGTIRTAGTPENPLFCLVDVCKALDLNPSKVAQRLESTVLSKYPAQTGFGIKEINFVNEDGLYDVILDSRKPEAKAFRKWVTSEVLPSIRKTGGYIAARPDESPEAIMARALKVADETMKRQQAALNEKDALIGEQNDQLRRLIPLEGYVQSALHAGATYTMTEVAQFLGFPNVSSFMDWVVGLGILFRQRGRWIPTPAYLGQGYFTTRVYRRMSSLNCMEEVFYTVVTEAGRKMLYDTYVSIGAPQHLIAGDVVETEIVEGGAL